MSVSSNIYDVVQLDATRLGRQVSAAELRKGQNLMVFDASQITIGVVHDVTDTQMRLISAPTWHSVVPHKSSATYYELKERRKLFSRGASSLPGVAEFVLNKFQFVDHADLKEGLEVLYFLNDRLLALSVVEDFTMEAAFMENGNVVAISDLMVPYAPKPLNEMPNLQRLLAKVDEYKTA